MYFVEYSEEVWNRFLSSKDFLQYCHFAGNLTANPHFQDLPALLKLKEQGVIDYSIVQREDLELPAKDLFEKYTKEIRGY